ncbi:MAG: MarR family transcriptional regulator [Bacteroidia bacterium]
MKKEVSDNKSTVCSKIKTSWHLINRMYNGAGSTQDLSTAMGFVLLNIHPENGTASTKIGPLLGMESKSLSRMLKGLEEKKWIKRKTSLEDKRSVIIYLTPKGLEKRELSKQTVKNFNKIVKEKLGKKKLKEFYATIDSINVIVDKLNTQQLIPTSK